MTVKPLDYLRELRAARHPELTPSVKLVLAIHVTHAGADGLDAHPGIELLAEETGLSPSTVKRSLRTARNLGWLLQVSSGRGGNHDKASVHHLAVPKGTGDPLGEESRGTGDTLGSFVKGSRATSQRVTDDRPKGTGDPTDALRDALRDDPALHKERGRGRKVKSSCQPGCWLGPGHLTPCRVNPLQPLRVPSVPDPEYPPDEYYQEEPSW